MRLLALAFILFSSTVSCSNSKIDDALEAANRFHNRFNSREYQAIVDEGSEELRNTATPEELVSFLQSIRENLGMFESSELLDMSVTVGTNGKTVSLVFDSKFERGHATETFGYESREDGLRLRFYDIRPESNKGAAEQT